jgi:hypothetical protein
MRKLAYLMTMILAIALISVSCCKDDEPENPVVPDITTKDFVGNWKFVSVEFNGTVYTEPCGSPFDDDYDGVAMEFRDVTTSTLKIYSICYNYTSTNIRYTFSNNIITLETEWAFQIMNVDEFKKNKNVLKLKLVNNGGNTTLPLNAIYELKKQTTNP